MTTRRKAKEYLASAHVCLTSVDYGSFSDPVIDKLLAQAQLALEEAMQRADDETAPEE